MKKFYQLQLAEKERERERINNNIHCSHFKSELCFFFLHSSLFFSNFSVMKWVSAIKRRKPIIIKKKYLRPITEFVSQLVAVWKHKLIKPIISFNVYTVQFMKRILCMSLALQFARSLMKNTIFSFTYTQYNPDIRSSSHTHTKKGMKV